ncbi:hypothetical protein E2C01_075551 [Portunus trituberculatus]|uniref:Uncharacterized protein n=1 Tax=Portunus trituberculatus TaxID=210409 RepID=A0A5B7IF92_PORTR|nr:hypothetical protein [Portunus trituberculatus]
MTKYGERVGGLGHTPRRGGKRDLLRVEEDDARKGIDKRRKIGELVWIGQGEGRLRRNGRDGVSEGTPRVARERLTLY